MQTIMIVEDEKVIRDAIVQELEKWNYEVVAVEDFSQVYTQFLAVNPQLVILDITLPFYNGYYWCQEIRKVSQVPIMFLSSRDQAMDIVMSINMGADDYMTKPFEPSVLVAKIQGMMRRSYEFVQQKDWLEYKGIALQLGSGKVSYEGNVIELSKNEFIILSIPNDILCSSVINLSVFTCMIPSVISLGLCLATKFSINLAFFGLLKSSNIIIE